MKFMDIVDCLLEDGTIGVSPGGFLHFVYENNEAYESIPVEALNVCNRSLNSLRRGKIFKISDLIEYLDNGRKLEDIASTGINTVKNIHTALLEFLWANMDREQQELYLGMFIYLNSEREEA